MYGLAGTCAHTSMWWMNPDCWFETAPVVAPPKPPAGPLLTVPPASGEDADATVTDLVNQQLRDQQALNATKVQSSWLDEVEGTLAQGGDAAGEILTVGFNWLPWAIGAAGVFALVTLTAGSPRRYGR